MNCSCPLWLGNALLPSRINWRGLLGERDVEVSFHDLLRQQLNEVYNSGRIDGSCKHKMFCRLRENQDMYSLMHSGTFFLKSSCKHSVEKEKQSYQMRAEEIVQHVKQLFHASVLWFTLSGQSQTLLKNTISQMTQYQTMWSIRHTQLTLIPK